MGAVQVSAAATPGALEQDLVVDGEAAVTDGQTINANIRLLPAAKARNLTSVNGDIVLAEGAQAAIVKTTNGTVRLEAGAQAGAIETINGKVELGPGAVVGKVSSINGEVVLRRAKASGVRTVHGAILLEGATVEGDVETTFGDLDIGTGAVVKGQVILHRPEGQWFGRMANRRLPVLKVADGAQVNGAVKLERRADVQLAPTAQVKLIERLFENPAKP
jgi:DUF4097 and DUF4098 domain-containing protein YvlB